MKIGKITVDAGNSEKSLKINSDRNTVFNLIDLYGHKVNVQKNGEGSIVASTVNVQQACESVLKDINITDNLNLLQGSTVSFENVDFHDAKINIYNFESEDPEKPLMNFVKKITEQPSKISIFKSEEGRVLEDDNIVLIKQPDSIFSEEQCTEWANKIKDGDYNQKQCIPPDAKDNNRKLVVKRESDDKGSKKDKLSAGAIAGIVIACVVVVAAIIALLVYFLVIKKKNASTTSTQGDSSIAI